MGIYIKGFKMPEGGYRTIEIAYDADGHPMAITDGGDVFDVIPAADVRPVVRATWEKVMEQPYLRKHYHVVACSACHKRGNQGWKYCPNCGADMRPEPPKEE